MLVGNHFDLPVDTESVCWSDEQLEVALSAINNHDKMAEMLVLHRSIFVHMLENIAPTATNADVEKVQDLVAQIDGVLGDE